MLPSPAWLLCGGALPGAGAAPTAFTPADSPGLELSLRVIGSLSQFIQQVEEGIALTPEQSVGLQPCYRPFGCSLGVGWANNRHFGELAAEEEGWLRHNQIGFQQRVR